MASYARGSSRTSRPMRSSASRRTRSTRSASDRVSPFMASGRRRHGAGTGGVSRFRPNPTSPPPPPPFATYCNAPGSSYSFMGLQLARPPAARPAARSPLSPPDLVSVYWQRRLIEHRADSSFSFLSPSSSASAGLGTRSSQELLGELVHGKVSLALRRTGRGYARAGCQVSTAARRNPGGTERSPARVSAAPGVASHGAHPPADDAPAGARSRTAQRS